MVAVIIPIEILPAAQSGADPVKVFPAGAHTVAVGGNLFDRSLVEQKDWDSLCARARQYVEACSGIP